MNVPFSVVMSKRSYFDCATMPLRNVSTDVSVGAVSVNVMFSVESTPDASGR